MTHREALGTWAKMEPAAIAGACAGELSYLRTHRYRSRRYDSFLCASCGDRLVMWEGVLAYLDTRNLLEREGEPIRLPGQHYPLLPTWAYACL